VCSLLHCSTAHCPTVCPSLPAPLLQVHVMLALKVPASQPPTFNIYRPATGRSRQNMTLQVPTLVELLVLAAVLHTARVGCSAEPWGSSSAWLRCRTMRAAAQLGCGVEL